MSCDCTNYQPIELDRQSINSRIKESKAIRKRMAQIAENPEMRIFLFRCPECGQLWQSGHEWNFKDQEYLFQVPLIEIADWENEPFQQPAAMMIHSAMMRDFFDKNTFDCSDSKCRTEGCTERAIRFSAFCRDHHIESLQRRGSLPQKPTGRMFPPYYVESQKNG